MVYMYIKNAAIVGVLLLLVSLLWVASRSQTESHTDPNNWWCHELWVQLQSTCTHQLG